jgi:CheY-like chemotaxis protein
VSAVSPPAAFVLQVLVVEDEVNLAHVFRDCVIALGHQAEVVGSAEAALERLQVAPPHVIILDVNLPGMSGMDFLALSVVRDFGIPIIVVSGFVTEEQARECLRLGALEFLAKPVPLEVLGTVLDHVAVFAHPPDTGPQERRQAGRLPVTLPLRVTAELGGVATGAVIEVSATGLRARLDRALEPGTAVRLSIGLPDGGAPLDALALVVRSDTDRTVAFWFLDLTPPEVERLLARAQARAARGVAGEGGIAERSPSAE